MHLLVFYWFGFNAIFNSIEFINSKILLRISHEQVWLLIFWYFWMLVSVRFLLFLLHSRHFQFYCYSFTIYYFKPLMQCLNSFLFVCLPLSFILVYFLNEISSKDSVIFFFFANKSNTLFTPATHTYTHTWTLKMQKRPISFALFRFYSPKKK